MILRSMKEAGICSRIYRMFATIKSLCLARVTPTLSKRTQYPVRDSHDHGTMFIGFSCDQQRLARMLARIAGAEDGIRDTPLQVHDGGQRGLLLRPHRLRRRASLSPQTTNEPERGRRAGSLPYLFVKLATWSFTPISFSWSCGTQPWKEEGNFLKLWCCIPDASLSLHRETLKNLLPHQRAISTLSEVFLQNHAFPSGQLATRKPKSETSWLFPQAQLSAKPWSH